jgi:hypothetical protein
MQLQPLNLYLLPHFSCFNQRLDLEPRPAFNSLEFWNLEKVCSFLVERNKAISALSFNLFHITYCLAFCYSDFYSDSTRLDRLCGLVVRVPGYRSTGPGFDSRRYQIFWEVLGLEWGPLSFVRIIEVLLERVVAAPVKKTEINGRGDLLRWRPDTLCRLKLALITPTSGGRSVGIVRWRTKPRNFYTRLCLPENDLLWNNLIS